MHNNEIEKGRCHTLLLLGKSATILNPTSSRTSQSIKLQHDSFEANGKHVELRSNIAPAVAIAAVTTGRLCTLIESEQFLVY